MNYYPHHIGDFNSATRHLTRIERSVYRDLIELYYDTEAPLSQDIDKLCRLLIARSDDEQNAVVQVLHEFFVESEQGWRHARCDAEIARYHGNKEAKSAAGKASAAKRARQAGMPARPAADQQPLNIRATNQKPQPEPQPEPQPNPPPERPQPESIIPKAAPVRSGKPAFDAAECALPDWLDRADWACWVADRKARKKPITQEAARRQLQQLAGYRAEGVAARDVIAHSIASGYLGLFPPRAAARVTAAHPSRQRAQWSSELRSVLAEGHVRGEIDMGVIDASR